MSLPLITTLLILLAATDLVAVTLSFVQVTKATQIYPFSTLYFYLVGILSWVAATRAWVRRPSSVTIRLSYLMSLCLLSVCAVGAVFHRADNSWASYLVPTTQFLACAFLPALFLHFFLIEPSRVLRVPRHWLLLVYLPALVFFLIWIHRYWNGISYTRSFFVILLPPLEAASFVYFVLYSSLAQGCLLYNCFRAPTRPQRRQSKWLLIGLGAGLMPLAFLVTLPTLLGWALPLRDYPTYALILIPVCYVVAIVRHRLMELELMLNKSAAYAIVSGFAIGTYLLAIELFQRAFQLTEDSSQVVFAMISALIVAVLFAPAKARVQNWIDRAFQREQYNYRQTLLDLSRTLSEILSLRQLANTLVGEVTRSMHIRNGALLVRDGGHFRIQTVHGGRTDDIEIPEHDPWLRYLQQLETPLRTRALLAPDTSAEMKALCQQIEPEVWVPFLAREGLIGVLLLGPKLSEEPYTYGDLSLLGNLIYQGAVATQNALLYEQLRIRTDALELARNQLMRAYVDTYGGELPETRRDDVVADFQAIATALKQSYERLTELDTLKTQFVSNVSHELGTPLTHIKGFVDNLLQGIGGPLTEKQARYLTRIADNCDRLIRLINDLLDLSRIEGGGIVLRPEWVPLASLLDELLLNMADRAQQRQIRITSQRLDGDLTIWADPDKLSQILINLLENALKFTDAGGQITLSTDQLDANAVAIHVEDNGIGIAAHELERIFDRFHQTPGTKERGTHGTGLGLAIVKLLVELHQGTIEIESTLGKGSRFSVTLPRTPAA